MKKRVCVTGATGYLGSHVVLDLLDRGFHVRAALREPKHPSKNKHVTDLAKGRSGTLELCAFDIDDEPTFVPAFEGTDAVIHTASAVTLTAKDPEREIVGVAVKGAEQAARAAIAAKVPRLVMTSSVAAVADIPDGHAYTEKEWNESATVKSDPYAVSKVRAERAARKIASESNGALSIVTILPSLILGPVLAEQHLRTSPAIIFELLKGAWPGVPDLRFAIVDVRDVARAHVQAIESGEQGRYITSAGSRSLRDLAPLLRELAPGAKVPTKNLPGIAMYLAAIFDKRLTMGFVKRNLGHAPDFDVSATKRELGTEMRSVEESVRDTVRSILDGKYL
jgi:nucleoside-diphosphate-sugar epimerase